MNIQIMKIYNESFSNVRSHKKEWLKVATGPLLVWAGGAVFLAFAFLMSGQATEMSKAVQTGDLRPMMEMHSPLMTIAHLVSNIAAYVGIMSLYINGYRYAILQEGGDRWITLNINMRLVKTFLYGIVVSILFVLYGMVSAGIIMGAHALIHNVGLDVILGILLGVYGFYLLFRIMLYPILISVDESSAIARSWSLMKGNVLRLIGLFILVMLTVLLIGVVASIVIGLLNALFFMISPVLGAISLSLWVVFAVYMVLLFWAVNSKAIGLVYKELVAPE